MEYICAKQYLGIPKGTTLIEEDGKIYFGLDRICYSTSQTAHDHFMPNEDGRGLERFEAINAIRGKINSLSKEYDEAAFAIVSDETLTDEEKEEGIAALHDKSLDAIDALKLHGLSEDGTLSNDVYTVDILTLINVKNIIDML